jgi:hypothetical protein
MRRYSCAPARSLRSIIISSACVIQFSYLTRTLAHCSQSLQDAAAERFELPPGYPVLQVSIISIVFDRWIDIVIVYVCTQNERRLADYRQLLPKLQVRFNCHPLSANEIPPPQRRS